MRALYLVLLASPSGRLTLLPFVPIFRPLAVPFSLFSPRASCLAAPVVGHSSNPCRCTPLLPRASRLFCLLLSSPWHSRCRAPWRPYGAPELELPLPAPSSSSSLRRLCLASILLPLPLQPTTTTLSLPLLLPL